MLRGPSEESACLLPLSRSTAEGEAAGGPFGAAQSLWAPKSPQLGRAAGPAGAKKVTSQVCECLQATELQLPTCRARETSHRETLARVAPSGDALVHYADGLTQDTFKICKEFLRPFKKCLRKLNLPKDFPKEKRLSCTRKNLTILGDHINMFLQHYCKTWELKHWKKMLWRFVSLFSALDEKQLCRLYRYSKTDQMAKFLKAYCRLESPDMVVLPDCGKLMKLRGTWGLRGGAKMQEKLKQVCSLSRDCDLPPGSMSKKRLHKRPSKARRKEGAEISHPTYMATISPTSTSNEAAKLSSAAEETPLKADH